MPGWPALWVAATADRRTSTASIIGLGVLVAFGYGTIMWRKRRGERAAVGSADPEAGAPAPGDPNRFELGEAVRPPAPPPPGPARPDRPAPPSGAARPPGGPAPAPDGTAGPTGGTPSPPGPPEVGPPAGQPVADDRHDRPGQG